MRVPAKIALGLAGISPIPLAIVCFAYFFHLTQAYSNDLIGLFNDHSLLIYLFNILAPLYLGAVHLLYIVHSARNRNMGPMYTTWVVCIVIFGVFAIPFYWYHHIWHEGPDTPRSGPLGLSSQANSDTGAG